MTPETPPPSDPTPRPNWRDPESYAHLRKLDRAGWAWEWLKRDPDFDAANRRVPKPTTVRTASGVIVSTLKIADVNTVARWGILFRRRRGRHPHGVLASHGHPVGPHGEGGAGIGEEYGCLRCAAV